MLCNRYNLKGGDVMGPKVKFTREQIIDSAFEIAQTEGIDSITMRKIAEKMGSSVAPIYVNFKSVDELREALIERIISISRRFIMEENTGSPFRDIGNASLRFAMEYSTIFRDLVVISGKYMHDYDEKMPIIDYHCHLNPQAEIIINGVNCFVPWFQNTSWLVICSFDKNSLKENKSR